MAKVKLTVVESNCRCGYCQKGEVFIIGDLCPPICPELWNVLYPFVYALLNGATLDYGAGREPMFDIRCPDENRVAIHGERLDE
jgi:uncharacterized repeat protein (TIGR04076 family)